METKLEKSNGKSNLFKPGQSGNPSGRRKGTRNQFSQNFIQAYSDDFDKNGPETIKRVRQTDPVAYLRIGAGVIPKEYDVKVTSEFDGVTQEEMTERTKAMILERAKHYGFVITEAPKNIKLIPSGDPSPVIDIQTGNGSKTIPPS